MTDFYHEQVSLKSYVGKTMIAWLYTVENFSTDSNPIVFVRPSHKKEGGEWIPVIEDDFPQFASIQVRLARGLQTAEDFVQDKKNLVLIQINDAGNYSGGNYLYGDDSYLYPREDGGKTKYRMLHNPKILKNQNQIWIDPFLEAQNFYQIIDANVAFEDLEQDKKLPVSDVIHTQDILVRCNDKYYGPFKADRIDNKYVRLTAKSENDSHIKVYTEDELSDDKLEIKNQNGEIAVRLIGKSALNILGDDGREKIDWLSGSDLVGYVTNLAKTFNYPKDFIKQINEFLNDIGETLTGQRKEKILAIKKDITEKHDFIRTLPKIIMEDEELREKIITNLPQDSDFVKENIHYKDIQQRLDDAETQIDDKNLKIQQLEKDLLLKNQTVTQQVVVKNDESLLKENEELKEKNNLLSEKIKQTEALYKNVEELESKKNDLEKECDRFLLKKEKIQEEIKNSIDNLKEESQIIAKKIDLKLMDNVLRLIDGTEIIDDNKKQTDVFDTKLLFNCEDARDFIDHVVKLLSETSRNISRNEVINYLTCISQGFITTFAGEPGTGKTSLCQLLAKSLGLDRSDNNKRFTEVSVERGWLSVKDFVGYYNPLTKTMEKSNVDVFNAFEQLSKEYNQEDVAPYFILLDEANLSPIEHYWSNFLKFCDATNLEARTLNLGGETKFNIPKHLRFLATVNFDHTTEELSPRFLDRSWIITLNPNENIELEDHALDNYNDVISYSSFEKFKTVNENLGRNDKLNNKQKWGVIQNIFRNCGLQIMPRNLKMVNDYLDIACQYMETNANQSQYAPIDYAVAQKILPLINGSGDNYKRLFEELKTEVYEMPLCSKHIERIVKSADQNMGYYQFFAK